MNREAFESKLQDLLDQRISPLADTDILRMVEAQPELRAVLHAYTAFASLRRPVPRPSKELDDRILRALDEAPLAAVRRSPAWLAPFIAVAATLVIATTLAFFAERGGKPAVGKGANTVADVANDPAAPRPPSLNRITRRAADNYRELANSTSESLSSALTVVQTAPAPESADRDENHWLRRVPDGLRPLSNSTSGAVFSLMRAVPSAKEQEREQY